MATNTFTGTGVWSDTTKWSLGRAPTIANADKVVIATGAVCTVDGVYSSGDDTTTAFTINGTLKYSRSANTGMTFRGTVVLGAGGVWDQGTKADPIPAAYRCDVLFNDSATMANNKYGFSVNATTAGIYVWGASKKTDTTIVALNSSSVFDVDDATGWTVGDFLFFGPTSPGNATVEVRAIQSLSPVSGTRYTVTLTAALTNANYIGRDVINVTRNVSIKNKDAANFVSPLAISLPISTAADNVVELGPVELVVGSAVAASTAFRLTAQKPTTVKEIDGPVMHDIVSVAGATVTTMSLGGIPAANASTFTIESVTPAKNCVIATKLARRGIASASTSLSNYENLVQIGQGLVISHNTNAVGAAGSLSINNPKFRGFTNLASGGPYIGYIKLVGGSLDGYTQLFNLGAALAGGGFTFDGCDLDGAVGASTPSPLIGLTTTGVIADITINNCDVPSAADITRVNNLRDAYFGSKIFFKAKDQDPTVQQMYTTGGEVWRDNTVKKRGASSVRFDCWYSANPLTYSFTIKAAAGQTITLRGAMGYSTTYGTATPPKVQMSGSGLTTQTATCALGGTLAADGSGVWNDYTLSITNTNAYPVDITVTYTGQSTANSTGAYCWFDGVIDSPWVDTAREFGYLYADTAYRTVDPSITVSEATALAYPVTFNHTTQAATVTGNLTARQLYEAFKASLAQTSAMGVTNAEANARISTSDGGVSFSTAYNVTVNTGCTLTGSFTTSGTVSLSGTGDVSGTYTDSTGKHVKLTAPYLVSGTRVQLWDLTAGTEMLNTQLSGTGLTYALTKTADKNVRLRCDHIDKLPLEATGTLTDAGLAFLVTQEDDTVYSGNGLDGDAILSSGEFTADYPHVQVDVSDADGITQPQRLYAWLSALQNTEDGIRNFFGAITAESAVSYVIEDSVVDLKLDNVGTNSVTFRDAFLRNRSGTSIVNPGRAYAINFEPGVPTVGGAVVTPGQLWSYSSRTLTDNTASDVTLIRALAAKLDTMLQAAGGSPGDYRFSQDALAVVPTVAAIADAVEVRTVAAVAGIKAKTDNLPAAPAAVSDVPSAAANATAVRVELAAELAHLDVAVSSRLASADYTAPDNSGIAAAKAVTDKVATMLEPGEGSPGDFEFSADALRNAPTGPVAPTAAEIADKVLGRNLGGGSDGGRTVRDALRASRNKTAITGTTLTVYEEDDATPAWTAEISTEARDALSGIDPA